MKYYSFTFVPDFFLSFNFSVMKEVSMTVLLLLCLLNYKIHNEFWNNNLIPDLFLKSGLNTKMRTQAFISYLFKKTKLNAKKVQLSMLHYVENKQGWRERAALSDSAKFSHFYGLYFSCYLILFLNLRTIPLCMAKSRTPILIHSTATISVFLVNLRAFTQ
ncbi:hypothetical protein BpHYR1_013811 [Brachionus plicatilis]|uniref:Uncharacterized protein n=1 Tax=Brachionus plicatilis TaxID=10195 RepID=A0A3M7SWW9_BRAPC|nr:hypothetical protein BpHYR1_013811 [Brachionus plicatilis]